MEDDFNVMDHEIQNHSDIRAAIRIRREAGHFQEPGILQLGFKGVQNGVEALDMPDLQDASQPGGRLRQLAGVGGCVGDGFFNEQVLTLAKQIHAGRMMRHRGSANRRGIDQVGEFLQ